MSVPVSKYFSAVLVGINKYPNSPLNGCVNDIVIMRDILVHKYNVPVQNIRLVVDNRATTQNIKQRLKWLIKNDSPYKLFYYSGHGSQIPNQWYDRGEEPDGLDEILCPIDLDWDGNYITDDDIDDMLKYLHPQYEMSMVFDACHSGTITRDIVVGNNTPNNKFRKRAKFIKPPLDILSRSPDVVLSNETLDLTYDMDSDDIVKEFNTMVVDKKLPLKKVKPRDNVFIISGCRDDQTSADAYINRRYQGAMSFFLQYLLSKDIKMPMYKLIDNVRKYLKNNDFDQEPQLTCPEKKMERPFIIVK